MHTFYRCRLQNGKILWLCKAHQESAKANTVADEEAMNAKIADFNDRALEIHEHAFNTASSVATEVVKKDVAAAPQQHHQ